MKFLLLASFVQKDELHKAIDQISSMLNLAKNEIFVFINEDDNAEYILSYNLNPEFSNMRFSTIWKNTISIHRKKQTNTLYSLNAMNELIKNKNGGYLDKSYNVNWGDYENSFLIIRGGKLVSVPIRLVKVNS